MLSAAFQWDQTLAMMKRKTAPSRLSPFSWTPMAKDKREASNDGSMEDIRTVIVHNPWVPSVWVQSGHSPPRQRPHVLQLSSLGTLWDATDEAATTHCSLLAQNRCRHCGPLRPGYCLCRAPDKPANHPWTLPERPWSRVHVDHTVNFLGSN